MLKDKNDYLLEYDVKFIISIIAMIGIVLLAAPMLEPQCDAAMIAKHAPTMTQGQYEEVVNVVWQMGGLTSKDAEALLKLIEEAYKTKDLSDWARAKCGEKDA